MTEQTRYENHQPDLPISYRRFEHSLGDDRGAFFAWLGRLTSYLHLRAEWWTLYERFVVKEGRLWKAEAEAEADDARDERDTQLCALDRGASTSLMADKWGALDGDDWF